MDFKSNYGMEYIVLSQPKVRVLNNFSNLIRPGTTGYLARSYVRDSFNSSLQFCILNVYRKGHSDKYIMKRVVIPTILSMPGTEITITKLTPTKQPSKSDHIFKTLSLLSSLITRDNGIKWANGMSKTIREHYNIIGIGVPIGLHRPNNRVDEYNERLLYAQRLLLEMCGDNHETQIICGIIYKLCSNFYAAVKNIHKNLKILSKYNEPLAKVCIEVRARALNLNYGGDDGALDMSIDSRLKRFVNDKMYRDYNKLVRFEHKFNRR